MNTLKFITLALVCTIAVAATAKKTRMQNTNEAASDQMSTSESNSEDKGSAVNKDGATSSLSLWGWGIKEGET